jgi:hypothetical protein
MKIVINSCHGGFGLSDKGVKEYKKRAGITDPNFYYWDIPRDCPHLVAMIEEQGTAINGDYSSLKVVEIPDDVEWQIEEYDGLEWVAEKHRTWS